MAGSRRDGSAPSETTMSTAVPLATCTPGRGFCCTISPTGTVSEYSVKVAPRTSFAEALDWTAEVYRAAGRLMAEAGTLEPGKRADLAIWNIGRPAELVYRMGFNPLQARVAGGIG